MADIEYNFIPGLLYKAELDFHAWKGIITSKEQWLELQQVCNLQGRFLELHSVFVPMESIAMCVHESVIINVGAHSFHIASFLYREKVFSLTDPQGTKSRYGNPLILTAFDPKKPLLMKEDFSYSSSSSSLIAATTTEDM